MNLSIVVLKELHIKSTYVADWKLKLSKVDDIQPISGIQLRVTK